MSAFVGLLVREARELLRDPFALGIAFVMPIILMFLFAYGMNFEVRHLTTAVLDEDKSPQSVEYVNSFSRTGYFDVIALPTRFEDAQTLLKRDTVNAIIIIPPEFSRNILGGRPAGSQVIVDGSFPPTATVAISYATVLAGVYSQQILTEDAARAGSAIPASINVEARVLYNPALRTRDFLVPGLLGVILLAFPPLLSSLAVVRERERGSLKQLQIARVNPLAFVLAKLIPYVVVGFGELALLLGLGILWFGVHFAGGLAAFSAIAALYVTAAAAIGLLISTFTSSQIVAMLVSLVATLMPSVLFSGFIYPIFNMPPVFQLYTYAFPARYFIDITRSMWLKGMPLEATGVTVAGLLLYTIILCALAVVRTRALVKAHV